MYEIHVMKTHNFLGYLQNEKLCNITMPGSHDAGITKGSFREMGFMGNASSVTTQNLSVGEQALRGARFFDVRLKVDGGQLVTYHGPLQGKYTSRIAGGTGQDFDEILYELLRFVKSHPSEFVIVRLAHLTNPKRTFKLLSEWMELNKGHFYKSIGNLANTLVARMSGKIIFVIDHKSLNAAGMGLTGLHGFHALYQNKKGKPIPEMTDGLCICGEFSGNTKLEKIIDGQLKNYTIHDGHRCRSESKAHLYCLYWTATSKSPFNNIENSNKIFRDNFGVVESMVESNTLKDIPAIGNVKAWGEKISAERLVRNKLSLNHPTPPNIVLYDFINEEQSLKIINLNRIFKSRF